MISLFYFEEVLFMNLKNYVLISLAVVVVSGCSSPRGLNQERLPASINYPLNPKFEQLLDNEDKLTSQIREGMVYLQETQAKKSGKRLRGTHAKGVCVRGNMEIFDGQHLSPEISKRIHLGLFSEPANYPTQVRFANAAGSVAPDQDPDVRAVSFSLEVPTRLSNPQGRMDFSMNNAVIFPINDAQVFSDLMIFDKTNRSKIKTAFKIGATRLLRLGEAGKIGDQQKAAFKNTPFQKMPFWSDVPFSLGNDEAVKYALIPCMANLSRPLTTDPDTLSKELARHVEHDQEMSCFDFQVQLLEADKMRDTNGDILPASYWVENSIVEWPLQYAPSYTVGRLTLEKNSISDADACESWKISVTHNNNEIHHGLGSLNRTRSSAESTSASLRQSR
jgi:hypothetical protein